jgi:outer membrane protein TolC
MRVQPILPVLVLAGLLVRAAVPGGGAAAEESSAAPLRPISLAECLTLALDLSPDVHIARLGVETATAAVEEKQGAFDPALQSAARYNRVRAPSYFGDIRIGDSDNLSLSTDLSGTLTSGTGYSLSMDWSVVNTEQTLFAGGDVYDSSLALGISQPLFRGRGKKIATSPIVLARDNQTVSMETLRRTLIETVTAVEEAYWNVILARESLQVARRSKELAENQLRRARAMVDRGLLAPVDLLAAKAGVAAREEAILTGEKALADARDALLQLLRAPQNLEQWNVLLDPSDLPAYEEIEIDLEQSVAQALTLRPEIRQLEARLHAAELSADLARNAVLPGLNLTSSLALNGEGDRFGNTMEDLTTGERYTARLGLTFNLPLRNRTARAQLRQAEIALRSIQAELERQRALIIQEVRSAARAVDTHRRRIQASQVAVEWARKKLQAEERKFELGRSTAIDVLNVQEDLAGAENTAISAVIDYRKALARYYRAIGRTLDAHGIQWADETKEEPTHG